MISWNILIIYWWYFTGSEWDINGILGISDGISMVFNDTQCSLAIVGINCKVALCQFQICWHTTATTQLQAQFISTLQRIFRASEGQAVVSYPLQAQQRPYHHCCSQLPLWKVARSTEEFYEKNVGYWACWTRVELNAPWADLNSQWIRSFRHLLAAYWGIPYHLSPINHHIVDCIPIMSTLGH